MHKISTILWTSIAIAQAATLGVRAADYVIDNGTIKNGLNASDGTEPRDNWFGNVFTAQAGANLLTRVDFGVSTTTSNMAASVVLYRITDACGNPAAGATCVYTQAFTPTVHTGSGFALQEITLSSPVLFTPGDRFLVAVFMANVIALSPNDLYPYALDTSGVATNTYWDRSEPNTFNLNDLSQAKPINQVLVTGGWAPDPGHIILRAHGVAPSAAADYVLDNNAAKYGLNASDGTEPHDNWFGNAFTAQPRANLITRVDFGVSATAANMAASVVFYRVTDAGGNPALGATRVYTQAFTPVQNSGSGFVLQQINLATPVLFNPGDRFVVAVFMPNVIALAPNDLYPFTLDTSGVATDTYWDRSDPNAFNLDDLSQAKPINQVLVTGGWAPDPGHVILRAHGIDPNPVADYVLDNGTLKYGLNASDGSEPHDNWFGNAFTAQVGANLITRVDLGVAVTAANMPADVVLYRITDPCGNPAAGATRVYTQAFTPTQHSGSGFVLQQINLTNAVLFNPGDRFLVAVFMPNVVALSPNDLYPYVLDTSGVATGTYWDRSDPNTFNLDDLSQAKPINQVLVTGGWAPDPGHVVLRAHGIDSKGLVLNPALDGANLAVSFTSQRGVIYQLQSTTSLGANLVWVNEGSSVTGTGIALAITVPASAAAKFFRVQAQ